MKWSSMVPEKMLSLIPISSMLAPSVMPFLFNLGFGTHLMCSGFFLNVQKESHGLAGIEPEWTVYRQERYPIESKDIPPEQPRDTISKTSRLC